MGRVEIAMVILLALVVVPSASTRAEWISDRLPPISEQERKALQLVEEWSGSRYSEPIRGRGGQVLYVYGLHAARIVCAPLRVCDLALQPGETLTSDPHLGDTARWLIGHAQSGPATEQISHLLIKPLDAGLVTTLYVPTTRRSYHLELLSHPTDYMPSVGFLYPEALTTERQKPSSQPSTAVQQTSSPDIPVTLEQLDFDYQIDGEAAWRPLRVFNDGSRTFIEFPRHLQGQPTPVLLVLDGNGQTDLVNYRVRANRYIVDGLFQRAALLVGVGSEQQQVTVVRGRP